MYKNLQIIFLLLIIFVSGCSSIKYSALEKVGIHKRDVLVDRIEDTQDAQQESKEVIVNAYEEFKKLVDIDATELEANYKRINAVVEDSQEASDEVKANIESVEDVSEALFEEWEAELEQYSNQELRARSEQKLRDSRREYASMVQQMYRAYDKIQPVLTVLKDQNLYLKHNLNARAVDALHGEILTIESDVNALVLEMDAAIQEADAFISQLN